MITRRTALRTGMAVAGGLGAAGSGAALLTTSAGAAQSAAADLDPATIEKFARPLLRLPVLQPQAGPTSDRYVMRQKETTAEIVPGKQAAVRTFDGNFAPPVIRAVSGRTTVVEQINNLPVATSIHLHGAHVPESSDGSPMDLIEVAGGTKTYTYPNAQPHANLWFHDHAHHQEAETVYRGLSGLYLLTDETEKALPLPSGEYDVPIALRDAHFDVDGQLVWVMNDPARNVVLANGRPWPYFKVARRKYRFRMVNTSNLRTFVLQLSDGSSFQQIGSDGGLLPKPFETTSVSLSAGERADIVIDFAKYPAGTKLVLNNGTLMPPGPEEHLSKILEFRVCRRVSDPSSVPPVLRQMPALGAVDRTRDFVLRMDPPPPTGSGAGYINDKTYDHERIDVEIPYGATEVWNVTNASTRAPHNFHVHLVQFRVLERNGQPVTGGSESGWKDTVNISPSETVKIQATFTGYRGRYVYHCHMIDHASMGMMATMKVV